jgi:hypothetical protein
MPSYEGRMRRIAILLLSAVLVACGGAADKDEDLREAPVTTETAADMSMPDMADKLIADSQSLAVLLFQVDSEATAEDIRPEIERMARDYTILSERFEAMGEPSFSDMAALASRAPQLIETQQAVARQIERIYTQHPDAADVLRDTLENVGRPTP